MPPGPPHPGGAHGGARKGAGGPGFTAQAKFRLFCIFRVARIYGPVQIYEKMGGGPNREEPEVSYLNIKL